MRQLDKRGRKYQEPRCDADHTCVSSRASTIQLSGTFGLAVQFGSSHRLLEVLKLCDESKFRTSTSGTNIFAIDRLSGGVLISIRGRMVDYSDRTSFAGQCPDSRFYVQVDWICKLWPTSRYQSRFAHRRKHLSDAIQPFRRAFH